MFSTPAELCCLQGWTVTVPPTDPQKRKVFKGITVIRMTSVVKGTNNNNE